MLKVILLVAALALSQRDPAVLRLAVVGDTGSGSAKVAAGIAAVHARAPLDGIVVTGDNFYPCGVTGPNDPRWSLIRPLTAIGPPVLPVLGNHDSCGNSKAEAQIDAPIPNWRFPARQYTVSAPLAEMLFLDTTPFAAGKDRKSVPAAIAAFALGPGTRHPGPKPWRIAVGHHIIVSSGWHGRFPRNEHDRMLSLLKPLKEAGVDLYLCGHDHHLELLDTRPRIVVSGAGSAPIPPVTRRLKTVWPDDPMRTIGFAVIELTPDTMTVRFYDAKGEPLSRSMSFLKSGE
jgi:3',5'-cyclic AMP phosphodiesterase CpdA